MDVGEDFPVATQALKLRDIETMAREAVAIRRQVAEHEFELDIHINSPLSAKLDALHSATRAAVRATETERAARRAVAHEAKALGLTVRDTAALMGISYRSVPQLLREDLEPADA